MTKQYKVLVNDGSDRAVSVVTQGAGEQGKPLRLIARSGARYELQDEANGRGRAPDQVKVKRQGKDLALMFDKSKSPDVVMEGYYDNPQNNRPSLVGVAEDGRTYEYQPHDPALSRLTNNLQEGGAPVLMSLGGEEWAAADVASAALLPVAAVGGGVSGWLLAGGAALAVASGGGGSGGAAAVAAPPSTPTKAPANYADDVGALKNASSTATTTDDTTPGVNIGAVPAGTTPTLYVDGVKVAASYDAATGTLTPTKALSEGPHALTYTLTNTAGSESGKSPALNITIDTQSPDQPTAQHLVNPDATLTVFGHAEAGSVVSVKFPDGSVGTTTAKADGTYEVTSVTPQFGGKYSATAMDAAGNASVAAEGVLNQGDGGAPTAPMIGDVVVNPNQTLTVSGTARPFSTVTVTFPDKSTADVFVDETGAFSVTSVLPQTSGQIQAVAVSGDLSSEVTQIQFTDTTIPASPTGIEVSADGTHVTGSAQPNSTVTVKSPDGTTLGSASVKPDGTFDVVINPAQTNGESLNVTTTDAGGTSAPSPVAAHDTTAPVAGIGHLTHDDINDTGTQTSDSVTSNTKPVLVITAEAGAKVELVVNGHTYVGVERANQKGTYDVKVADALPDGNYQPAIFVTDAAGNKSAEGKCTQFTIDTSGQYNPANGVGADLNTGISTSITIQAITDDTGTSAKDFVTSDNTLLVSGNVVNFSSSDIAVGDQVWVRVVNASGQVVAQEYVPVTATNTWAMHAPTNALPDGDYTLKAAIVDAAGNVVKNAVDQPVKISGVYLATMADTATAQESGVDAQKTTVQAINPTGNVLSNDVDVHASGLTVKDIKYGNGAASSVTAGSTSTSQGVSVAGQYGVLTIGADGSYTYTVDDTKTQPLTVNDHPTETFTYTALNSAGTQSTAVLTVTVNGANDLAVITAKTSIADTQVSMLASDTTLKTGTVVVNDVDSGQSVFQQPTSGMLQGSYGTFTFNDQGSNNGTWTYALDLTKSGLGALAGSTVVTDTLKLSSVDGGATQDIVITITGVNDAPLLTLSNTLAMPVIDQNTTDPLGASSGIKVSDLMGGISDVDTGAQKGIAITSVDTTHGALWFTTDSGSHWNQMTGVDTTHAMLLSSDANTRLYYRDNANVDPAIHDASAINTAFSFVAWDQTSGGVGTQADASVRGGTTAFSSNVQDVLLNDTFYLNVATDTFKGGSGFDTLALNTTLPNLDVTTLNLSGIEKIATNGNGVNTITVNVASIDQADLTAGVHQLFIEGDTGSSADVVEVKGHASVVATTSSVPGYDRYVLDATHELLLQHGLAMHFTP